MYDTIIKRGSALDSFKNIHGKKIEIIVNYVFHENTHCIVYK